MDLEYHITCCGRKKILKTNSRTKLCDAVKESFGLDRGAKITFQLFDKKWEDFIDIEPEDLPSTGKLQVLTETTVTVQSLG